MTEPEFKVGEYVCWKGGVYTLEGIVGSVERGMAWLASANHFSYYSVPISELKVYNGMSLTGCREPEALAQ